MADIIELKATDLAAMLCSRVCHDLINPVGAIGNGLEVLADPTQGAMAEGAQELIANSAKQARAKLEFARLAYGASSTAGTDFDTRECERVAILHAAGWQRPVPRACHLRIEALIEHVIHDRAGGRRETDAEAAENQRVPRHHARRREEHTDDRREHEQLHDSGLREHVVVAPARQRRRVSFA